MNRHIIVLTIGAILISLTLTACGAQDGIQAGDKAPEIEAENWYNSDDTVTLKSLRGKVAVVEFWATWCPPCRTSIPHLNKLHDQYKDRDVVIIGLSRENRSKVEGFVEKMDMRYIVGDGSGTIDLYGVEGIPTAFVLDTNGTVLWRGHPMNKLEDAIDQALAKAPKKKQGSSSKSSDRSEEAKQAPEISAQAWYNSDGPVSLASLRGQIAVVEFWATWCPPCRDSIPHLNEVHDLYRDKGVTIIGLSDEDPDKVSDFVDKMDMRYIVGAGSNSGGEYGVRGIPHAFVLDTSGAITWNGHPMSGLEEAIDAAIKATPPEVKASKSKKDDTGRQHRSETKGSNSRGSETKKGNNMNPTVIMETSMGIVTIELWPDKSPITVKNFLRYTDEKYYNGTIFHRVITDFMIQGGGFTPDMNQKKTHDPIKNEAKGDVKNKRGTLAMARTGVVDSATSQFFINVVDNDFLTHKSKTPRGYGYCVFGQVIDGMDVMDKMRKVKTGNKGGHQNVPIEPLTIISIRRAAE